MLYPSRKVPDLGTLALGVLVTLCGCDDVSIDLEDAESRISGNTRLTLVYQEDTVPDDGVYPEVMRVQLPGTLGNCRGTVVAPDAEAREGVMG